MELGVLLHELLNYHYMIMESRNNGNNNTYHVNIIVGENNSSFGNSVPILNHRFDSREMYDLMIEPILARPEDYVYFSAPLRAKRSKIEHSGFTESTIPDTVTDSLRRPRNIVLNDQFGILKTNKDHEKIQNITNGVLIKTPTASFQNINGDSSPEKYNFFDPYNPRPITGERFNIDANINNNYESNYFESIPRVSREGDEETEPGVRFTPPPYLPPIPPTTPLPPPFQLPPPPPPPPPPPLSSNNDATGFTIKTWNVPKLANNVITSKNAHADLINEIKTIGSTKLRKVNNSVINNDNRQSVVDSELGRKLKGRRKNIGDEIENEEEYNDDEDEKQPGNISDTLSAIISERIPFDGQPLNNDGAGNDSEWNAEIKN